MLAVLAGCTATCWAIVARLTAPAGNTAQPRFDAMIVLGGGVDRDGNPAPETMARITEGVREYERGVAPRLIMSSGIARGKFPEAAIMARVAEAQGIPQSAIYLEPRANDTIQNACYSADLMKAHGWTSAEVVTSSSHVPRAAIIFSETPIAWRMHTAPSMELASGWYARKMEALEILKTVRYLLYAQWGDRCSH